jgi:hypothetical protein
MPITFGNEFLANLKRNGPGSRESAIKNIIMNYIKRPESLLLNISSFEN